MIIMLLMWKFHAYDISKTDFKRQDLKSLKSLYFPWNKFGEFALKRMYVYHNFEFFADSAHVVVAEWSKASVHISDHLVKNTWWPFQSYRQMAQFLP